MHIRKPYVKIIFFVLQLKRNLTKKRKRDWKYLSISVETHSIYEHFVKTCQLNHTINVRSWYRTLRNCQDIKSCCGTNHIFHQGHGWFSNAKNNDQLLIYGIKFWKQGKDLNVLKPIPINNKTLTSIPLFSIPS